MTHGRRFSSSRRLMAPFSTTFTRRSQAQVSCRQIIKLLRNYFLRILGPPALIASSASPEGLLQYNRPIYNYIMRGVVTAFTGIRKRDELTQVVHLIHFMGGSRGKEMNSKATHLMCSNAFGDKCRYALTFRLNVVRSSWVLEA